MNTDFCLDLCQVTRKKLDRKSLYKRLMISRDYALSELKQICKTETLPWPWLVSRNKTEQGKQCNNSHQH